MARTSSTAKKTTTAPAKKTAAPAKKATAAKKTATPARPARKTTAAKPATAKTAPTPRLSLVKPVDLRKPADLRAQLPTRARDWMTDTQGFATLAARLAGITTPNIQAWHDHRDNTCTRALTDGSHLHYALATRTLTWHALCPMGATHQYPLTTPSVAAAARVHADRCTTPHADLTHIPALTADELAAYGIHTAPTLDRALPGEPETTSKVVPLPTPEPEPVPRVLADQLTHPDASAADTQPLNRQEIADGIAARADHDQPKEHPQP